MQNPEPKYIAVEMPYFTSSHWHILDLSRNFLFKTFSLEKACEKLGIGVEELSIEPIARPWS